MNNVRLYEHVPNEYLLEINSGAFALVNRLTEILEQARLTFNETQRELERRLADR